MSATPAATAQPEPISQRSILVNAIGVPIRVTRFLRL
jgi:hypothetical protein